MEHVPFCVFKRSGRNCYYVKFRTDDGKYTPAISTKQVTKAAALAIAYEWHKNGKPIADGVIVSVDIADIAQQIKTTAEADIVCHDLQKRGLLKSFTISGSRQDVNFISFLLSFWNFDESPYIKEKLRKCHSIHRSYTKENIEVIKKYWQPVFKEKLLGDITRQNIDEFINTLSEFKLSPARKNKIIKTGTIALRWAFSKGLIDKNIAEHITLFSEQTKERKILTPKIVEALFRITWKNERVKLANLLSAVTGMRAGEVKALQVQDLHTDHIDVKHSYNSIDGLKTTKTNEVRTVEVPFPNLIDDLLAIAKQNPAGVKSDSFVFWSTRDPSKPMSAVTFIEGLRASLQKVGMKKEEAKTYVFHAWRHFYTSYMRQKIDPKLLQSQTGHKSMAMLDHYSSHRIEGDKEAIRKAGREVFSHVIQASKSIAEE